VPQSKSKDQLFLFVCIFLPVLLAFFTYNPIVNFLKSNFQKERPYSSAVNASCLGRAHEYELNFSHFLYLNKEMIPIEMENKADFYKDAIKSQLRYLAVTLPEVNQSLALKWAALSHEKPLIKINNISSKSYSMDFRIDNFSPLKHFLKTQPYISNAIKRGYALQSDRAVVINYEAKIKMAICSTGNFNPADMNIPLPRDPFLAYWYVSDNQRRLIKWKKNKKTRRVNPCADSEIADLKLPQDYWYAWNPFQKGYDEQEDFFDCQNLLKEQVHYDRVKVTFARRTLIKEKELTFERLEQDPSTPLNMSLLLSLDKVKHKPFETGKVNDLILEFLKDISFKEARKNLPFWENEYDFNLNVLLVLLWNLNQQMTITEKNVNVLESSVGVHLKGILNKSQKSVNIRILLVPTPSRTKKSEVFVDFFRNSLNSDDIILYNGHSRLGKYLTKEINQRSFYDKNLSDENRIRNIDYQILGLFSCYSYTYFPPEDFPLPDHRTQNFSRQLIYVAASYLDTTTKTIVAFIDSLDLYFTNKKKIPFSEFSIRANIDSLLVHHQQH